MADERKVKLDDIAKGMGTGLSRADEYRATQFEQLQFVRNAKATSLQREHARLSAKYGPNHPRVKALAYKSVHNIGLLGNIVAETIRAKTEIPVADEDTWILHGYVRDKDGAGLGHLTVALYSKAGEWIDDLGYACTAANGYFKIETTSDAIRRQLSAYIRVLNNKAEHLYVAGTAVKPLPGEVDYREIVLSGEGQVCVPPGESRDDPTGDPDAWIVRGRVTDENGKGVGGLIVSLYDKDLIFDDRLGQTETDNQGSYSFIYQAEDFRDLIERKPDIYLKVLDQNDETLHTSKRKLRCEAGRVEIINIKLER
jgi:hypothetical protein